jgi:hypothetical protein
MKILWVVAVVCVGLGTSLPAAAQTPRPERPYRGLFGSGVADVGSSLVLSVSLGGGYDTNVIAETRGGTLTRANDWNTDFSSAQASSTASLSYRLNTSRFVIGATAGTSGRYYPSVIDRVLRRDNAQLRVSARLAEGLTVSASGTYAPYDLTRFFLSELDPSLDAPAPELEFVSSPEHYIAYQGNASWRRPLTQRTRFDALYGYRGREASTAVDQFKSHRGGAGLTHTLGRGLEVRGGYRYAIAYYGASREPLHNHIIDAGINFNRRLSFSRQTTLSFGTGTSATSRPIGDNTVTRFFASGHVDLNHEIGRTWHAAVAYRRGAQFVDTWPEPVFSDALTASLSGLLGRRLQAGINTRVSTGRGGLSEDAARFTAVYTTASVALAITRNLAWTTAYTYYRHQFPDGVVLAPGFTDYLDRHSVRGSLNVWLPLFQTIRRGDAAR